MVDGAHASLYYGGAGAERELLRDRKTKKTCSPIGVVQQLDIHSVSLQIVFVLFAVK